MRRNQVSKMIAMFLAFALVITCAVPANAALNDQEQDSPWYESISEMLEAGEYEEGVVIAGIDMSKARRSGDPGSALETQKLSEDTEELIYVDPEDALTQKEFISWFKELRDDTAGQQDDGICIIAISRSDMTTARILELLASDDSVVFAEPNYIMGVESEDDAADTEAVTSVSDMSSSDSSSSNTPEIEAEDQDNSDTAEAGDEVPEDDEPSEGTSGDEGTIGQEKGDTADSGMEEPEDDDPAAGTTDEYNGDTADTSEAALEDGETAAEIDDRNNGAETTEQDYSDIADTSEAALEDEELIAETENQAAFKISASKIGKGTDGDGSGLQWSSNENASLHAAYRSGDVSIKVPGWPDGSNMDHEIIVAVVDLPVDFSNPDLDDRAYTFSPELKAKLGCDDHGFNATWESRDGKIKLYEGGDHGTHVAGIIGASWDGKGINGVGSNVKIVSVQISNDGSTSLINALRGMNFIKKAVENGVDIRIANNSWAQEQSSKALDAAITELGNHGVISFFAAGNDSKDLNATVDTGGFLAENPYAIVVASTTPTGELADSSCYGKGIVTLGAPGAGILSCVQTQSAQYIPALASQNKIYENFEDGEAGTSDPAGVKVCQVGFKSVYDEELDYYDRLPDPDNPISGTEGVVVSGNSEMGFEGRNVLKVNIDRSGLSEDTGNNIALRIDFGDVSEAGVSAGDVLGFVYGSKAELEPIKIVDTASGSIPQVSIFISSRRNCWNTHTYTLKEGIDTKNLSFVFEVAVNDADEIYLDTFGIGNEKLPYAFKNGTSMASPAAAGAAAVIASRHYTELQGMDAPEAAERLANLVRSSVRPLASLRDVTSTGGIIDLTVDTDASDPADQPGPDITDVSVDGRVVILTGTDFGNSQGTAAVRKYVAGAPSDITASVTAWSDSAAALALEEDFEGIIEVELTSSNGKKDTIVKYISKSSNIFEKDHHIGSETGDPFEFNEPEQSDGSAEILGDFETSGILVAGDSKLYYMPEITKVEENPAYRRMYSYDPGTDSWTVCPAYPSWIKKASGAWFDGKLYVKGTSVDVDDTGTIPYTDSESEEPDTICVYSYTPGDSSWKKCSTAGVADEHTLFAAGSGLMLAGVTEEESYELSDKFPTVRDYDPASGAGDPLGYSPSQEANPKAVYAGGRVFILEFDYWNQLYILNDSMSASDEDCIDLPEFYYGAEDKSYLEKESVADYEIALVSYGDLVILTGPAARDGSSDTFILKVGETSFRPLDKRASDAEVFMPSAAVLDGRLYVIGASVFEPGKRVFRSTMLPESDTEQFTITYDLNGGNINGSTANITEEYEKGTVISIHEAPVREGYTFEFWKGSEYRPGDKYTVTENHTFIAQWEKDNVPEKPDDTPVDSNDGKKESGKSVRSGDESHPGLWMALALLAAAGVAVVVIMRRRANRME